jgi:Voltage gated chloride channel
VFIYVNVILGNWRKRYITSKRAKVAEAIFFALATSIVFYLVALTRRDECVAKPVGVHGDAAHNFQFTCPEGYYNPFASLVFNTEAGILRQFLEYPIHIKENIHGVGVVSTQNIVLYLAVWYFFTITTYGIWVPSGLFLSGINIGCCIGLLYLQGMVTIGFPIENIGGQAYVVIGAAAMTAAYCKWTYSICIIMLETTQSINNFLPITLGIAVSLVVARAFNRSLYEYALRSKQVPMIRNNMPKSTKHMFVKEVVHDLLSKGYEL